MTRLAARTTFLLTVALVAVMQAVVSPASCCLLKATISSGKICCRGEVKPVSRSCCHRDDRNLPEASSLAGLRLPSPSQNCPVCSAEPKVATADRVAAPSPDDGNAFSVSDAADAFGSTAFDAAAVHAAAFGTDEPFQRTALASCAYLCVWRI
jgi:hypothetical protein